MRSIFVSTLRMIFLVIVGIFIGIFVANPINDMVRILSPGATQNKAEAAWEDFGRTIARVSSRILEEDFPSLSDRDRAEGIRQLSHVIVDGLRWEFDHSSAEFTSILVNNTDTSGWGGPNVDNKYLRGRIDGKSTYVLTGNVSQIAEIAIQTNKGDLHQGQIGSSATMDLAMIEADEKGDFKIFISPERHEGNWIKLAPDHTILSLRVYYYDWRTAESGRFSLVKQGHEGLAPPALTEAEAAQRVANASRWIESNILGWDKWQKLAMASAEENKANGPRSVDGGSSTLLYGGIPFSLQKDEALIIEIVDPQARYYSIQTYTYGWFDAGDYANRQTSLNQFQTHQSSDGVIRYVACGSDPGVANWIDIEERNRGLLTYRYMGAKNPQRPTVKKVAIAELANYLPADTVRVTKEQRKNNIALRQRHVQQRFHN